MFLKWMVSLCPSLEGQIVAIDGKTIRGSHHRRVGKSAIHMVSAFACGHGLVLGQVERANQTLQDRLVKEMRLSGMNDQASANAWLPTFMADFNRRFAVTPTESSDAHVVYQGKENTLRRILSVQDERILSKNLSCQHEKKLLQVKTEGQGLSLRGAKVVVHSHSDGSMELLWRGRALAFETFVKPPVQHAPVDGKGINARVDCALKKRAGTVPAKNHPWKKAADGAFDATPVIAQFPQPEGHMFAQTASP